MRAHLTAAASAALLLGLVGCSGAEEPAEPTEPATTVETPPAEVEPLVAEPVEEDTVEGTPEERYLAAMRERLEADRPPISATQIPNATDEQLLQAAHDACEQLAAGTRHEEVRVIEGEEPNQMDTYVDSNDIAFHASEHICTDYQLP